ncbi:MAG TPA: tRNA pseudouridine(38-40) synthase TruA [Clostridiaceae bacterium]|nr:tRNA pseudouridine(38-40) synthase TruA [Clostridiaceae bacterium]
MERNIKLIIEYDGTNYNGWQSQMNGTAIQDIVEGALFQLTGEKVKLTGSGRTDSGVHAYGQVANFFSTSSIPAEKFSFALNTILPKDIIIKKSLEVGSEFHARFSAKGKKYRYLIYNSTHPSALLRNRTFHVFYNLNIAAMKEASSHFIGTYNFEGFMAKGSQVKNTIRTIWETSLIKRDEIIQIEITGDGFLYNMVRIIVGTLIDVGIGRIKTQDISNIIRSCDRKLAGRTAPPQGLYLVEVYY